VHDDLALESTERTHIPGFSVRVESPFLRLKCPHEEQGTLGCHRLEHDIVANLNRKVRMIEVPTRMLALVPLS
jgi:hypothetical protein